MPLLLEENIQPDVKLAIWEISETLEDFFTLYPYTEILCSSVKDLYKSADRRCEIVAVRLLIRKILGGDVSLFHKKNGQPYLSSGMNISISHTRGFAAIIVSQSKKVSIDIEYISKRIERIKHKFMRNDENASSYLELLMHWCAKETMYKMFAEDNLSFNKMQLLSIDGNDTSGIITAKNISRNINLLVNYRMFDSFLLTFAIL